MCSQSKLRTTVIGKNDFCFPGVLAKNNLNIASLTWWTPSKRYWYLHFWNAKQTKNQQHIKDSILNSGYLLTETRVLKIFLYILCPLATKKGMAWYNSEFSKVLQRWCQLQQYSWLSKLSLKKQETVQPFCFLSLFSWDLADQIQRYSISGISTAWFFFFSSNRWI